MDYFFQRTCLCFLGAMNGVLRRIVGFSKDRPLKMKANKLSEYRSRGMMEKVKSLL